MTVGAIVIETEFKVSRWFYKLLDLRVLTTNTISTHDIRLKGSFLFVIAITMPYSTPSTSSSRTAASLYQANLFDVNRKNPRVEPQDRLSDIDSEDEPPPSHPSTPPRPLLVVDTALSPQSQSSFPVNQIPTACPAHPSPLVKPLKSSFKRRLSFPPALPPRPAVHRRASDPSPPPFEREPTASPKAVHFRESKLETVCFFRETAKPSALLTRSPPPPTPCYVINTAGSDPIPNPSPASQGVVIIEDVHMEEMTMKGSIVVRNYAYEKAVAVLFTMDDWQTRSEVVARYSASLPSTEGEWDRFGFSIHLDHQALSLASRTMYLAARFSAAGGEWWDNNCGKNYCIRFSQGLSFSAAVCGSY